MSPEDLATYLREPHTGVIATLRKDGMPYTVPIWWLWKPEPAAAPYPAGKLSYPGGHLWLTGTYSRVWCQQLLADPRASLCIESGPPVTGHVGFDGPCEAMERPDFDIWPISHELAWKYVGRDDPANAAAVEKFFTNMQTEPRLLFRMKPRVLRAIDMRVYRGKRADREFQEQQRGE